MRHVILILCVSLLLSALAPTRWAVVEPVAQRLSVLHGTQDALPPYACATRVDELHRWWSDDMKARDFQQADLALTLEPRTTRLSVPGEYFHGSTTPTLLAEHVRLQV